MSFTDIEDANSSYAAKERALNEAQKVIAGDVPLISIPVETVVHLPRGLFVDSKWQSEVELRELTGADEEDLARFKDPMDFFDGVITHGVVRVGNVDLSGMSMPERKANLLRLLIGEREQLFINIARVTYGDEKELTHSCPACATEMVTTIRLSEDIKFAEMKNPQQVAYSYVTSKGDSIEYSLATGIDQMEVLNKKGASSAEQNTLMLSRCINRVNDKIVVDPLAFARNLSMKDRRMILEGLTANQPTPEMGIKLSCITCDFNFVLPLSWGDIFRP